MIRKRILIENVGGYRQSAVLHSPQSIAWRNWIKGGASKSFRNFWRLLLDSPLSSWSGSKWSASLIKVFFVNMRSEMTEMWYYRSDDQIFRLEWERGLTILQLWRAKLFKIIFSRILKKFPGFLSWTKMKMKKKRIMNVELTLFKLTKNTTHCVVSLCNDLKMY